jgi:hypothetical protein
MRRARTEEKINSPRGYKQWEREKYKLYECDAPGSAELENDNRW